MISSSEFRNGKVIKMGGDLYTIIFFQHIKPGKGGAFVRTKLKNLRLHTVIDKTFRESELVEDVFIDQKKMQFLYQSDGIYHFMENKTYEQVEIDKEHVEDCLPYLKEGEIVTINLYEGDVISLNPPLFVNLKVVHTEPGIRGDTAKGGFKSAELETGLTVQVPLFISNGELLKIDTRTGRYVERA